MTNQTALLSLSQTTDFGSNPVIMQKKNKNPTSTAQHKTLADFEPFNVLLAEIGAFQVCFLLTLRRC